MTTVPRVLPHGAPRMLRNVSTNRPTGRRVHLHLSSVWLIIWRFMHHICKYFILFSPFPLRLCVIWSLLAQKSAVWLSTKLWERSIFLWSPQRSSRWRWSRDIAAAFSQHSEHWRAPYQDDRWSPASPCFPPASPLRRVWADAFCSSEMQQKSSRKQLVVCDDLKW